MGFFSWKTHDTNESIPNIYSQEETFTVYMIDNAGNVWKESNYEGYGIIGGKDYYELVAEMNGKKTRYEGINMFFSENSDDYLYPTLARNPKTKWKNRKPESCEYQGYFYPMEEDEYLW